MGLFGFGKKKGKSLEERVRERGMVLVKEGSKVPEGYVMTSDVVKGASSDVYEAENRALDFAKKGGFRYISEPTYQHKSVEVVLLRVYAKKN